jgi:hypothetical protein
LKGEKRRSPEYQDVCENNLPVEAGEKEARMAVLGEAAAGDKEARIAVLREAAAGEREAQMAVLGGAHQSQCCCPTDPCIKYHYTGMVDVFPIYVPTPHHFSESRLLFQPKYEACVFNRV